MNIEKVVTYIMFALIIAFAIWQFLYPALYGPNRADMDAQIHYNKTGQP